MGKVPGYDGKVTRLSTLKFPLPGSVMLGRSLNFVCACMPVQSLSCVQLFATSTVALHTPLSMEFSRQDYQSGLSFPTPGNLPDPGIEPGSPLLQMDSLPLVPPESPRFSSLLLLNQWDDGKYCHQCIKKNLGSFGVPKENTSRAFFFISWTNGSKTASKPQNAK